MTSRARPQRPIRLWTDADQRRPKGAVRRAAEEIGAFAIITLTFSFIAAVPMRLIFGSWTPWTFLAGAGLTAIIYGHSAISRRRKRDIARQWYAAGWTDAPPRPWPWDAVVKATHGVVQVRVARSQVVRGFPVTVVDGFWVGDGVGAAATSPAAVGKIVVVRLPRSYPPTSVQRRRAPGPLTVGDEFDQRFRLVIGEPYFATSLLGPTLRGSHVAGRIPTWTIYGDELYAVVAEQAFTPYSGGRAQRPPANHPMPLAQAMLLVDRVLTIVELLRIKP